MAVHLTRIYTKTGDAGTTGLGNFERVAKTDPRIVAYADVDECNAALGVALMWLSYRLFDRLTPQVDFAEELKKGNVAVAIFIAALFVSIALIVGRALN